MTTSVTISNTSQPGNNYSHTIELETSDSELPIVLQPGQCHVITIWQGKTVKITELPLEDEKV